MQQVTAIKMITRKYREDVSAADTCKSRSCNLGQIRTELSEEYMVGGKLEFVALQGGCACRANVYEVAISCNVLETYIQLVPLDIFRGNRHTVDRRNLGQLD